MCKLKLSIASVAFCVVLCGLFHEECRHAVFADTVSGLLVGFVHGVLHLYRIHEVAHSWKSLTPPRAWKIIVHYMRVDMAIGLLIGVVNAIICMCAGW
jgi:hypothetical protein